MRLQATGIRFQVVLAPPGIGCGMKISHSEVRCRREITVCTPYLKPAA